MNRKEAAELLPIIKAFSEGKVIESRSKIFNEDWKEVTEIHGFSYISYAFRIKPEPKYRPFKDAEECWQEMQKHQPLGFTKFKDTKSGYYMITCIARGIVDGMNKTPLSYETMFDDYTFADGTPFGVKVEE